MAQLPVAIRRDIRDNVDATDSPLQQQISTLQETLGLPVRLEVNWSHLWAECEQSFAEKSTFVPYILPYMTTLLDAINQNIEEDTSAWTEKFLEVTTQCHGLTLEIRACEQNNPRVRWLDGIGLSLYVPIKPVTAQMTTCHVMLGYLDDLFATESRKLSSPIRQSSRPSTSNSNAGVLTPTSSMSFSSDFPLPEPKSESRLSPLPKLEALPRPDLLLTQSRLHIIHMRIERDRRQLNHSVANSNVQYLPDRIIIHSTHESSLKLIHEYFSKWTKPDMQTREKVPLLRHTLYTSALGHGHSDTLVAEPFSQMSARSGSTLNPALYQYFIEDVLGYDVVYRSTSEACSSASWEFRSYKPLA